MDGTLVEIERNLECAKNDKDKMMIRYWETIREARIILEQKLLERCKTRIPKKKI